MPFSIRPSRRFPVCCPITYHCGLFEGHGTVWNLSLTGWRFSGNLPLRIGEVCSLTVNLSSHPRLYVAAGIVRWVRGEEYGVETLVMDEESREDMEQYICQRVEDKWIAIHEQRTARPRNQEVDRDF
ncbi:MAG TPA: PilZ domain-containing protein [Nitrospiraceae bacterium]|nr:PilZ domain-containing protein [Nitrospiraceae bacterium]